MAKSVTNNIIAKGTLDIFNTLLPFILVPYVYRILGRDCIGNIEYMMTLFSYFGILGLLGTYNYGIRSISNNRNDLAKIKDTYKNLFSIGIISNLFFFICYLLFVRYFISDPAIKVIGYIYSGNLLAQALNVEWFNEAFEEFRFITIKTMVIRLISVAAIFTLVRTPEDAIIYVFILSIVCILNYLVSFCYAQHKIGLSFRETFQHLHMRDFIAPLLIILVLKNTGVLYTIADRTMLGHYTGTANVGLFSIGQKIVEIAKTLVLSVVFATLPRLALYLKEDKELYISGLHKIIRLLVALLFPVGIGLFLLSDQVILLIGGEEYIGAVPAMRIFSLRIIFLGIESIIYNQVLFLHGKERVILKYNLFCGLLNVALNFMLLNILSPFTAILSTWICEIIFESLCILYIKRNLKFNLGLFNKANCRYLILSLLFAPIVLGIKHLPLSELSQLAVSICICASLYIGTLYFLKDKTLYEILLRFHIIKNLP